MRHIHPFPARMAPEIALDYLQTLNKNSLVLDPMSGSGMVVKESARKGLRSIGCDLDPLAQLISKVSATKVDENKVINAVEELIQLCKKNSKNTFRLSWIDDDEETQKFINFWFDTKQKKELSLISYFLIEKPFIKNKKILDLIKVAVSRLIITKEPKASLARDTAHSRPHRTITKNNFSVIDEILKSTKHVLKALTPNEIKQNAKIYLSDARSMTRIKSGTIDAIITSPPYLNAIDYMRGHKLSLIWFGYQIKHLRNIRAKTIGSERKADLYEAKKFENLLKELDLSDLQTKEYKMLNKYYKDLLKQLKESYRVLKKDRTALYVIGNSSIKGNYIKNSEILKHCANYVGFKSISETTRDIPDNRRYLPITITNSNSLSKRMRVEHIIIFQK